jgi:hypothetical protein
MRHLQKFLKCTKVEFTHSIFLLYPRCPHKNSFKWAPWHLYGKRRFENHRSLCIPLRGLWFSPQWLLDSLVSNALGIVVQIADYLQPKHSYHNGHYHKVEWPEKVVQPCIPISLKGRDRDDPGLRPALTDFLGEQTSKVTTATWPVQCLLCNNEAPSSNPSPAHTIQASKTVEG